MPSNFIPTNLQEMIAKGIDDPIKQMLCVLTVPEVYAIAKDSPSYGKYDGHFWWLDVRAVVAYHLGLNVYHPLFTHCGDTIKQYGRKFYDSKENCTAVFEGYKTFLANIEKLTLESTGIPLCKIR